MFLITGFSAPTVKNSLLWKHCYRQQIGFCVYRTQNTNLFFFSLWVCCVAAPDEVDLLLVPETALLCITFLLLPASHLWSTNVCQTNISSCFNATKITDAAFLHTDAHNDRKPHTTEHLHLVFSQSLLSTAPASQLLHNQLGNVLQINKT